jgi:hypothetical protein
MCGVRPSSLVPRESKAISEDREYEVISYPVLLTCLPKGPVHG